MVTEENPAEEHRDVQIPACRPTGIFHSVDWHQLMTFRRISLPISSHFRNCLAVKINTLRSPQNVGNHVISHHGVAFQNVWIFNNTSVTAHITISCLQSVQSALYSLNQELEFFKTTFIDNGYSFKQIQRLADSADCLPTMTSEVLVYHYGRSPPSSDQSTMVLVWRRLGCIIFLVNVAGLHWSDESFSWD